jgi:membrane dipeptidase
VPLPVFDAHADSLQRAWDLGHDLAERGEGHLDLVRGREGGLAALVFVSWVDPSHIGAPGGAFERTRGLLSAFHELAARRPDRLRWAGNGRMLAEARALDLVAGIPGIEGGHSIEEDLGKLELFFEHGVRVLTLVWNNHLPWIRSCRGGAGAGVPEGLSPFGREVVARMNELGMLVDLSHAGPRSFYDALEASTRPVIASHSGCRALHDHPRNLDDHQLRALGAAGGVVGIVFCTAFLDAAAQAEDERVRKTEAYARAGEGAANETERFLAQSRVLQEGCRPLSVEVVADHVEHAVEVSGIEHVGIGSDYDGIQRTPAGLEDASRYPRLAEALRARGFGADDVEKVFFGNMCRVFGQATGAGTRAHLAGLTPLDITNGRKSEASRPPR